ncbi:HAD-like domain-containing protein [Mycotypha africana]|uniref:HAD-like domain-containing protein n=1 Tax=Mycotypha africana TaxID=64632 RepID=UPI0023017288|nr:HAD-like domain-containing protein [Mycotypha africana]KAI8984537.1 HAD-like domain-containing protein [Mycotypha africana]
MAPTALVTPPNYANIKVIASDMDGTLVSGYYDSDRLTDRTIAVLRAAEKKGIRIIMASGRPIRSFIPIIKQAQLENPMIVGCNGGMVMDSKTMQIVRKYSIETEAVRALIKEVKNHFGDDILIGGESGASFRCEEAYAQKRWDWIGDIYERVDDLHYLADEEHTIEKLMLLHREWTADVLYEYLLKNVLTDPKWKTMINPTFSSPFFVEVSAVGICKATAVKDICEKLNVKSEEVIAFGDMPNDIEMLQFAGTAVAMGNAHQSVKEIADFVTLSNNEEGVAVVLEEVVKQI